MIYPFILKKFNGILTEFLVKALMTDVLFVKLFFIINESHSVYTFKKQACTCQPSSHTLLCPLGVMFGCV